MRLQRAFFEQPTLKVASNLLGKYLVRKLSEGRTLIGRIIETEAYLGFQDRASHAFGGKTPRNEVMFGKPGYSYIYLIYGRYWCLNVVTEKEGYPAAVLIRGVEAFGSQDRLVLDGPGKVCRFFQIDNSLNKKDLTKLGELGIEDRGEVIPKKDIKKSPRIGVDYAGESAKLPWRFYIPINP